MKLMNQLQYILKKFTIWLLEKELEDIKIKIGSTFPDDDFDKATLEVRGLHLLSVYLDQLL